MTDPIDPVETLARALWEHHHPAGYHPSDYHDEARALLAQITPALVAEAVRAEREANAKACDKIAGNTLDFDRDTRRAAGMCAAAIRARTP